MAEILPEGGLYQKIIHRTEKLLTEPHKSRSSLIKTIVGILRGGEKFAIITGFPDSQGYCNLD